MRENLSQLHILVSIIYKVLKEKKKLNTEKTTTQLKIGAWNKTELSKEEIWRVEKYSFKASTSLLIKAMQIKTTLGFYLTPVRMAKIKKQTMKTNDNKCAWLWRKRDISPLLVRGKTSANQCKPVRVWNPVQTSESVKTREELPQKARDNSTTFYFCFPRVLILFSLWNYRELIWLILTSSSLQQKHKSDSKPGGNLSVTPKLGVCN